MSFLSKNANLIKPGIAMMAIAIASVNYAQSNNSALEANTTIRSLTKISSANASGEVYCVPAAEMCYIVIDDMPHYVSNAMPGER